MAFALSDIKLAALRCFMDKLVVVISEPVAAVPATINPDEEFSFDVTITNPRSENGRRAITGG